MIDPLTHFPDLARALASPFWVVISNHPDADQQTLTGAAVYYSAPEARACLQAWSRRGPAACLEVGLDRLTRDVTADMMGGTP